MQTNHNLVLDEGVHAGAIRCPNLDIEENDVKCSHGSTVGPADEDQQYYLESRGVEPDGAERLIVAGFFEAIADQVPSPDPATIGRALVPGRGCTCLKRRNGRRGRGPVGSAGGRPHPREARRFDVAGLRVALARIEDDSTPWATV